MVILIGGAGYTGKTAMAQKILEKYKIPYLSADHLKMGIFRGCPGCGFTPESPDEIITEKLWPIIKGIIMTNIENGQNITIEGCYFPKSVDELENSCLQKIIMFNIGFSGEYIRKNLPGKITENKNIIEKRKYHFDKKADDYIAENNNKKEISTENNIKYFEIGNNYKKEIKKIYQWLDGKIKKIAKKENSA